MQHQRHAHGFEAASGQFRPRGGGRRRQFGTVHMREGNAATLQQIAFFEDAAVTAAAKGVLWTLLPLFAPECLAVQAFQFRDDAILQGGEVVADRGDVDLGCAHVRCQMSDPGRTAQVFLVMARCPMSRRNCAPSK